MQPGRNTQLMEDLRQIFGPGVPPPEDRVLLDSFVADRDEAAFEALVSRHGPMVRGVCRRLLRDSHDADDAFQATFLVLVLKSRLIRHGDRLGPWLYGVATRVATKARAQAARRRDQHGGQVETLGTHDPSYDLSDLMPLLDAEIGRLPGKLRQAVVLCLAEGATAEEAARRLGCPVGTVKSRLARGRAALQINLIKRGIAPSVTLAAGSSLAPAPVSAALLRSTVATALASPITPTLFTLTRGVAPAMISKSTALAALFVGGITLVGGGLMTNWPKSPALAQQPANPAKLDGQPEPDKARLRRESMDHVKTLNLAFQNYLGTQDHFPPAAIYGIDGQPNLSWRVALLPYLDEEALYKEFHLTEPWDSPQNKALIPRMPAIFATPDSPAPAGQTRFRGFHGKGAMFEGKRGISFEEVTDGVGNTLLFAQASDPIVWTQPGELPFKPGRPIPALGSNDPTWALVGTTEGAGLYVPRFDVTLLEKMITRNGGEVIASWPPQPFRSGPVDPVATTTPPVNPTPPASSSVEQRLQTLENKLDRLIQRLDTQPGGGGGKP